MLHKSVPAIHLCPDAEHRWSDVVPPHTALTFAAIWDPIDGLVVFSGAALLADAPPPPALAPDSVSLAPTLGASTLAGLRTAHQSLFALARARTPGDVAGTRASSTLGGADVYLRASLAGLLRRFPAPDSPGDEGFFDSSAGEYLAPPEPVLSSAFSTTTTSTSNYVTVDPADAASAWSTLDAPPPTVSTSFAAARARLRKRRRPREAPASPAEVLARKEYCPAPKACCGSLVRGLSWWRRNALGEGWVRVEV